MLKRFTVCTKDSPDLFAACLIALAAEFNAFNKKLKFKFSIPISNFAEQAENFVVRISIFGLNFMTLLDWYIYF